MVLRESKMDRNYKIAVVIGRWQPFHLAHESIIKHALEAAERVIIVIGGHRGTQTTKNPWSTDERIKMISASLPLERISFVTVRDTPYNDNTWLASIQEKVAEAVGDESKICLVGSLSDDTSYYLKSFPKWKPVLLPALKNFHASDIRKMYFEGDMREVQGCVPPAVFAFLTQFKTTNEFKNLVDEYLFIKKYQEDWLSAPYPPTFVTVDAVIVQSGHIVVVTRRGMPGKGLKALPGGFLAQRETVVNGIIREAKEETGLFLSPEMVGIPRVFDNPDRSLRGRTITHVARISLGNGPLEKIRGGDDAAKAQWMSFNEVIENEDRFFEDHLAIIQEML